jgi:hypothetical protein
MTPQDFHAPEPFRPQPFRRMPSDADAELDRFTLPYAGQPRMRLTVTSGIADARIRVEPEATDLLAIDLGDCIQPRVRVSASELRVSWPFTFESWLRGLVGVSRDIEITLHPAVEWTLQVRGGLSRCEVDLARGKLERLEISGGVSDARIDLPAARAVVTIRISGGSSNLALRRPADSAVALAVSGGISALVLDDQEFASIGGEARLSSGSALGDTPRYAVEIGGGASALQIVPRAAP